MKKNIEYNNSTLIMIEALYRRRRIGINKAYVYRITKNKGK